MLRNSRKSVLSSFIASAALFAAAGLADAKNITIYQHEFTANSVTDIEAGYGYVPGSLVLTAVDEGTPVDANGNTFNGANIGSAGYTAVLLVLSTAGYRGGANTGGSKINLQYFTPRASAYAASSSYGITGSFLQQWYVEQNNIGVISESAYEPDRTGNGFNESINAAGYYEGDSHWLINPSGAGNLTLDAETENQTTIFSPAANSGYAGAYTSSNSGYRWGAGTTITGAVAESAVSANLSSTEDVFYLVVPTGSAITVNGVAFLSSNTSAIQIDTSFLVPEPASLGLMAIGAAGLLIRRRKKKA